MHSPEPAPSSGAHPLADSDLVALVAHELRAPLTVIRSYFDLLELPLDAEARERATRAAISAAQRMSRMLDDLSAARGLRLAERRPVDLVAVAREALHALGPDAERIVFEPMVPTVVGGDSGLLLQAATNLLSNALRYSPADQPVMVSVTTDGADAVLTVSDKGTGVTEAEREVIFSPFERASAGRAKRGLGLGLFVVRAVAEAHGGTARALPVEAGARFELRLPLADSAGSGQDVSRAHSSA